MEGIPEYGVEIAAGYRTFAAGKQQRPVQNLSIAVRLIYF